MTVPTRYAARKADKTEHGGEIVDGSHNVTINGLPAARFKDFHACSADTDGYQHVGGPITEGCATVTINGLMAARKEDHLICTGPDAEGKNDTGTEKDKVTIKREQKTTKGKIIDEKKEGKFGSPKTDQRKGPTKYQKKPLFNLKGQLVEKGDSGTVKEFWGKHGKLLTGEYHVKSQGDIEVRSINDIRAQIDVIDIGASGSVVHLESDKVDLGVVNGKGSIDVLKGKIDGKVGAYIDTQKKQVWVGAEYEAGVSALEGKISGSTEKWRIPFTNWGISFEGEASGALLTAKAAGHYGVRYDPKNGFSLRAGGKVGAGWFGGGLGFGINIGPMDPPEIPRDKIITASSNVIIGH